MALKIAQLGQPVLRERTTPVDPQEIASPAFQQFIDQMLETLVHANGAGLAAPQVNCNKRVFVAGILPPKGNGQAPQVEVLINPKLTQLSPERESAWEGCLSFIELLVYVSRHVRLRVEYLDRYGASKSLELDDFAARVVQHEYDHLDGILTIDRAASTRDIIKASELDAVMKARGQSRSTDS
jgi:peptide deformylase